MQAPSLQRDMRQPASQPPRVTILSGSRCISQYPLRLLFCLFYYRSHCRSLLALCFPHSASRPPPFARCGQESWPRNWPASGGHASSDQGSGWHANLFVRCPSTLQFVVTNYRGPRKKGSRGHKFPAVESCGLLLEKKWPPTPLPQIRGGILFLFPRPPANAYPAYRSHSAPCLGRTVSRKPGSRCQSCLSESQYQRGTKGDSSALHKLHAKSSRVVRLPAKRHLKPLAAQAAHGQSPPMIGPIDPYRHFHDGISWITGANNCPNYDRLRPYEPPAIS